MNSFHILDAALLGVVFKVIAISAGALCIRALLLRYQRIEDAYLAGIASMAAMFAGPVLGWLWPVWNLSALQALSFSPPFAISSQTSSWAWLTLGWALAASAFLARFAKGWLRLCQRSRRAARHPVWTQQARQFAQQTNLRGCAHLDVCTDPHTTTPWVFGFWRPVLMLPIQAQLWTQTQRTLVVHHELAHLHRKDPLSGLFTEVACAFHWYNPLIWRLRTKLAQERELATDRLVLSQSVHTPSDYADTLLHVVKTRAQYTTALGQHPLAQRIHSILDRPSKPLPTLDKRPALLLFATAVLLAGCGNNAIHSTFSCDDYFGPNDLQTALQTRRNHPDSQIVIHSPHPDGSLTYDDWTRIESCLDNPGTAL